MGPLFMLVALSQDATDVDAVVREVVPRLVKLQEADGSWPYEGVYRERGAIPAGYRAGGTALVMTALLHAPADLPELARARDRGLDLLLKLVDDPALQPSTENAYDVRVWGQSCALEFFCRLGGGRVRDPAARLVRTLAEEELRGGGWNYAWREQHASFVTAPVAQALLWAKSRSIDMPEDLLSRARRKLEACRASTGAFAYMGDEAGRDPRNRVAGAAARMPLGESTLRLLGGGSVEALQASLDAFHANWHELEKRRRRDGTHEGPFGIAPYYFYFGHRYAAQAVELLPEAARPREREKLRALVLKTRDDDGLWNDRVFPRSRAVCSALALLALMGDRVPAAPK
jgi:hypothetical protein